MLVYKGVVIEAEIGDLSRKGYFRIVYYLSFSGATILE